MQRQLSCVIFDLDGTLTQTNDLIYATFNHVASRYIGKTLTQAEIAAYFGPPEEIAVERLVGKEHQPAAIDDFYKFYETHHSAMATAYSGMRETLEYLKSRKVLLAVFTGKGRTTTTVTLRESGLGDYFDMIVTGSDVAHHKPSGEGIRNILTSLGISPGQALMVGDSVSDIKAAREAGVAIASVVWDSYGKDMVMAMDVDYRFETVQHFARWLTTMVPGTGAVHP